MIPKHYQEAFCYSKEANLIEFCEYFICPDCPETCQYSIHIKGDKAKGKDIADLLMSDSPASLPDFWRDLR